jgi:hypothetical protein
MTLGTTSFAPGGYRYIPAVFQYSGGVAAEPGFALERVRFLKPPPMAEAFAAVEAHLAGVGRPTAAFAQCELRSPDPFSDQGFIEFNTHYVKTLERWGLFKDGVNPVARSNVCPMYGKPDESRMFAFTYTVPSNIGRPTFQLSGSADAHTGNAPVRERAIAPGDTSPEGLRTKVVFVADEMERRLAALGVGWADAVETQIYTVQNVGHLVGAELFRRGAGAGGLVWNYARPPVIGLEFEMDVRGYARETVI